MKIKEVILLHYKLYPASQLEDFFKLIYQNEFGPGHLISNREEYVKYILEEKKIKHINRKVEPIGNKLLRVDVSCIEDVELFASFARQSAILNNTGTKSSFLKKIDLLKKIIVDCEVPVSTKNFNEVLDLYVKNGFAPRSHSDFYKKQYDPHYRVISEKFWKKYLKSFNKIKSKANKIKNK